MISTSCRQRRISSSITPASGHRSQLSRFATGTVGSLAGRPGHRMGNPVRSAVWALPERVRGAWPHLSPNPPTITEAAKRKILGLNSARLYGLPHAADASSHSVYRPGTRRLRLADDRRVQGDHGVSWVRCRRHAASTQRLFLRRRVPREHPLRLGAARVTRYVDARPRSDARARVLWRLG